MAAAIVTNLVNLPGTQSKLEWPAPLPCATQVPQWTELDVNARLIIISRLWVFKRKYDVDRVSQPRRASIPPLTRSNPARKRSRLLLSLPHDEDIAASEEIIDPNRDRTHAQQKCLRGESCPCPPPDLPQKRDRPEDGLFASSIPESYCDLSSEDGFTQHAGGKKKKRTQYSSFNAPENNDPDEPGDGGTGGGSNRNGDTGRTGGGYSGNGDDEDKKDRARDPSPDNETGFETFATGGRGRNGAYETDKLDDRLGAKPRFRAFDNMKSNDTRPSREISSGNNTTATGTNPFSSWGSKWDTGMTDDETTNKKDELYHDAWGSNQPKTIKKNKSRSALRGFEESEERKAEETSNAKFNNADFEIASSEKRDKKKKDVLDVGNEPNQGSFSEAQNTGAVDPWASPWTATTVKGRRKGPNTLLDPSQDRYRSVPVPPTQDVDFWANLDSASSPKGKKETPEKNTDPDSAPRRPASRSSKENASWDTPMDATKKDKDTRKKGKVAEPEPEPKPERISAAAARTKEPVLDTAPEPKPRPPSVGPGVKESSSGWSLWGATKKVLKATIIDQPPVEPAVVVDNNDGSQINRESSSIKDKDSIEESKGDNENESWGIWGFQKKDKKKSPSPAPLPSRVDKDEVDSYNDVDGWDTPQVEHRPSRPAATSVAQIPSRENSVARSRDKKLNKERSDDFIKNTPEPTEDAALRAQESAKAAAEALEAKIAAEEAELEKLRSKASKALRRFKRLSAEDQQRLDELTQRANARADAADAAAAAAASEAHVADYIGEAQSPRDSGIQVIREASAARDLDGQAAKAKARADVEVDIAAEEAELDKLKAKAARAVKRFKKLNVEDQQRLDELSERAAARAAAELQADKIAKEQALQAAREAKELKALQAAREAEELKALQAAREAEEIQAREAKERAIREAEERAAYEAREQAATEAREMKADKAELEMLQAKKKPLKSEKLRILQLTERIQSRRAIRDTYAGNAQTATMELPSHKAEERIPSEGDEQTKREARDMEAARKAEEAIDDANLEALTNKLRKNKRLSPQDRDRFDKLTNKINSRMAAVTDESTQIVHETDKRTTSEAGEQAAPEAEDQVTESGWGLPFSRRDKKKSPPPRAPTPPRIDLDETDRDINTNVWDTPRVELEQNSAATAWAARVTPEENELASLHTQKPNVGINSKIPKRFDEMKNADLYDEQTTVRQAEEREDINRETQAMEEARKAQEAARKAQEAEEDAEFVQLTAKLRTRKRPPMKDQERLRQLTEKIKARSTNVNNDGGNKGSAQETEELAVQRVKVKPAANEADRPALRKTDEHAKDDTRDEAEAEAARKAEMARKADDDKDDAELQALKAKLSRRNKLSPKDRDRYDFLIEKINARLAVIDTPVKDAQAVMEAAREAEEPANPITDEQPASKADEEAAKPFWGWGRSKELKETPRPVSPPGPMSPLLEVNEDNSKTNANIWDDPQPDPAAAALAAQIAMEEKELASLQAQKRKKGLNSRNQNRLDELIKNANRRAEQAAMEEAARVAEEPIHPNADKQPAPEEDEAIESFWGWGRSKEVKEPPRPVSPTDRLPPLLEVNEDNSKVDANIWDDPQEDPFAATLAAEIALEEEEELASLQAQKRKRGLSSRNQKRLNELLINADRRAKLAAIKEAEEKERAIKEAEEKERAVKEAEEKERAIKEAEEKERAIKEAEDKERAIKEAEEKERADREAQSTESGWGWGFSMRGGKKTPPAAPTQSVVDTSPPINVDEADPKIANNDSELKSEEDLAAAALAARIASEENAIARLQQKKLTKGLNVRGQQRLDELLKNARDRAAQAAIKEAEEKERARLAAIKQAEEKERELAAIKEAEDKERADREAESMEFGRGWGFPMKSRRATPPSESVPPPIIPDESNLDIDTNGSGGPRVETEQYLDVEIVAEENELAELLERKRQGRVLSSKKQKRLDELIKKASRRAKLAAAKEAEEEERARVAALKEAEERERAEQAALKEAKEKRRAERAALKEAEERERAKQAALKETEEREQAERAASEAKERIRAKIVAAREAEERERVEQAKIAAAREAEERERAERAALEAKEKKRAKLAAAREAEERERVEQAKIAAAREAEEKERAERAALEAKERIRAKIAAAREAEERERVEQAKIAAAREAEEMERTERAALEAKEKKRAKIAAAREAEERERARLAAAREAEERERAERAALEAKERIRAKIAAARQAEERERAEQAALEAKEKKRAKIAAAREAEEKERAKLAAAKDAEEKAKLAAAKEDEEKKQAEQAALREAEEKKRAESEAKAAESSWLWGWREKKKPAPPEPVPPLVEETEPSPDNDANVLADASGEPQKDQDSAAAAAALVAQIVSEENELAFLQAQKRKRGLSSKGQKRLDELTKNANDRAAQAAMKQTEKEQAEREARAMDTVRKAEEAKEDAELEALKAKLLKKKRLSTKNQERLNFLTERINARSAAMDTENLHENIPHETEALGFREQAAGQPDELSIRKAEKYAKVEAKEEAMRKAEEQAKRDQQEAEDAAVSKKPKQSSKFNDKASKPSIKKKQDEIDDFDLDDVNLTVEQANEILSDVPPPTKPKSNDPFAFWGAKNTLKNPTPGVLSTPQARHSAATNPGFSESHGVLQDNTIDAAKPAYVGPVEDNWMPKYKSKVAKFAEKPQKSEPASHDIQGDTIRMSQRQPSLPWPHSGREIKSFQTDKDVLPGNFPMSDDDRDNGYDGRYTRDEDEAAEVIDTSFKGRKPEKITSKLKTVDIADFSPPRERLPKKSKKSKFRDDLIAPVPPAAPHPPPAAPDSPGVFTTAAPEAKPSRTERIQMNGDLSTSRGMRPPSATPYMDEKMYSRSGPDIKKPRVETAEKLSSRDLDPDQGEKRHDDMAMPPTSRSRMNGVFQSAPALSHSTSTRNKITIKPSSRRHSVEMSGGLVSSPEEMPPMASKAVRLLEMKKSYDERDQRTGAAAMDRDVATIGARDHTPSPDKSTRRRSKARVDDNVIVIDTNGPVHVAPLKRSDSDNKRGAPNHSGGLVHSTPRPEPPHEPRRRSTYHATDDDGIPDKRAKRTRRLSSLEPDPDREARRAARRARREQEKLEEARLEKEARREKRRRQEEQEKEEIRKQEEREARKAERRAAREREAQRLAQEEAEEKEAERAERHRRRRLEKEAAAAAAAQEAEAEAEAYRATRATRHRTRHIGESENEEERRRRHEARRAEKAIRHRSVPVESYAYGRDKPSRYTDDERRRTTIRPQPPDDEHRRTVRPHPSDDEYRRTIRPNPPHDERRRSTFWSHPQDHGLMTDDVQDADDEEARRAARRAARKAERHHDANRESEDVRRRSREKYYDTNKEYEDDRRRRRVRQEEREHREPRESREPREHREHRDHREHPDGSGERAQREVPFADAPRNSWWKKFTG